MADNIYLIQNDGKLQAMSEQPYNNEELLQKLLEDYPELLGADQLDATIPRRLLLIAREFGVPGEQDGYDRWALDHLFIDREGVPTLVEVKRSSDTRIRREVVGQMLDYAANAIVYWPLENIRSRFQATCEKKGELALEVVARFLASEPSDEAAVENFWSLVKTNLQAGKIRLVFVADKIPTELQRIVEFLNEQMDPAEVIAIELRQYVGEGVKTLVPRVLGQTAMAIQKKTPGVGERKQWDEASFFADAENQGLSKSQIAVVRKLYDFSMNRCNDIGWGTGKSRGSFNPKFHHICIRSPYSVYSDGEVMLNLKWLNDETATKYRDRLKTEIAKIPGISLSDSPFPTIPLRSWENKVDQVVVALQKVIQQRSGGFFVCLGLNGRGMKKWGTGWFFNRNSGSETKASKIPTISPIATFSPRKSSKTSKPPSNNSAKSPPT